MLFLVILCIALGWASLAWSWARQAMSSGYGIGIPLSGATHSRWGVPRDREMARRRRRDVLTALVVAAVVTLIFAQTWAGLLAVHLIVDCALVAYGWAVYRLEVGAPNVQEIAAQRAVSDPSSYPITDPTFV